MINTFNKQKLLIALTFVMAISCVLVFNVLCNVGLITIEEKHQHASSESFNHETHHDHHGNVNEIDLDLDKSKGHSHHTTETEECCKDLTTPFFDNLIKQKVKTFEFYKIKSIEFVNYYDRFSVVKFNNKKALNLFLYYDLPPPIPGDQLRILHQSFLL